VRPSTYFFVLLYDFVLWGFQICFQEKLRFKVLEGARTMFRLADTNNFQALG